MSKYYSRRLSKKIYQPNTLSLGINDDHQNITILNHKSQQAKHIQQQKQIDKMLQKIIKQRMFGSVLAKGPRVPANFFSQPFRTNRNSKEKSAILQGRSKQKKYCTLQTFSAQKIQTYRQKINSRIVSGSPFRDHNTKLAKLSFTNYEKNMEEKYDLKRLRTNSLISKKSLRTIKPLLISELKHFPDYFRKLTGNYSSIIHDIRITRQMILNQTKDCIHPRLIDRYFHFFNFPLSCSYRQYIKIIQSSFNSEPREIGYLVFRVLDENGKGYLTIGDLFRFLKSFPKDEYIDSQIYFIAKQIESKMVQMGQFQNKEVKPTLEQILVLNHSLRLQEVRELMKESKQQMINTNCKKNTCYNQSILALQHDPIVRIKNNQIQSTENASKKSKHSERKKINHLKQDGLGLRGFLKLFEARRPKIFCVLANALAGANNADYQ